MPVNPSTYVKTNNYIINNSLGNSSLGLSSKLDGGVASLTSVRKDNLRDSAPDSARVNIMRHLTKSRLKIMSRA